METRKRKTTTPGARSTSSAKKQRTTKSSASTKGKPTETTKSSSAGRIDVQQMTEEITASVTKTVLNTLKELGLLKANNIETQGSSNDAPLNTNVDLMVDRDIEHEGVLGLRTSVESSGSSCSSAGSSGIPLNSGFVSSKLPLHATVPMKTKEKIWNQEYVELSALQEEEPEDISFNIRTGKVSTVQSKKKFLNIEQWTDAFSIYASVFRLKFPEEAEGLASYMGLVRRIAEEKAGWYYYDTNFRKLKKTLNLKWGEIENELFLVALSRRQPFRVPREGDKRNYNTRKFSACFKYDKGQNCPGCNYPHRCGFCGGSHPQFKCFKKGNKQDPSPKQDKQNDGTATKQQPAQTPKPKNHYGGK